MKIYLLRHGETDWNKNHDTPYTEDNHNCALNAHGVGQAKRAAELLQGRGIGCVYASGLKRACQTGKILSDAIGAEFYTVPGLQEFSTYDESFVGKTRAEIHDHLGYDSLLTRRDERDALMDWRPVADCETKREARDRITKTVNDICEKSQWDTIAIASHGVILRELMRACGYDDDSSLSNCEIIEAKYDGKLTILRRIKDIRIANLKNKKVAIWGLGVEGKAVLEVLNADFPDKEITILSDDNAHLIADEDINVVIRSPGVSIYKPEVIAAKQCGTTFITEKTLFFNEIYEAYGKKRPKVITITGTKGKTTTTTFCAHLLSKMGYKTVLCGNMGVPTIKLIQEAKDSDFVVVEISSYQASDLNVMTIDAAILLNLFPEHIDWHGTHARYYEDKMNLLNSARYKIINASDAKTSKYRMSDAIKFGAKPGIFYENGAFYDDSQKIVCTNNMQLLGEHNYRNLCSVLTAIKILGVDLSKIKQEYFDDFKPVKYRLEVIKVSDDMIFIDDSIATIPEAAIACYEIFKNKNIFGILGGYNREQDYSMLAEYISRNKNIKYITLLGQTSQRLADLLSKNGFHDFKICRDLDECVATFKDKLRENSVVVLSPAAPSYDMFKNFEERGKEFERLIAKYYGADIISL